MLLDTSGLLCLHHKSESYHLDAIRSYQQAQRRITHSYVLAEFVALATARRLPRLSALSYIDDLLGNPDIETVWVDESLHCDAITLLRSRPDKAYSLCDAVSFVLMRQFNVIDALSTDHHFEQEGFRKLLG